MESMALFRVCLFLLIIYHAKCKSILSEQVCSSPDCIDSANLLLRVMNKKGDPCNDFYDYACGNFDNEFPVKEFHRSWFRDATYRVDRMITQVLKNPSVTNSESLAKTKAFYESCMNTELRQKLKLQPLYDLLAKIGLPKFPTADTAAEFNLGKTIGLVQRYLRMQIIVTLAIGQGQIRPGERNDTFILTVSPAAGGPLMEVIPKPEFKSLLKIVSAEQIRNDNANRNIIEEMDLNQVLNFTESVFKVILDDVGLVDESVPSHQTDIKRDVSEMQKFAVGLNEILADSENGTEVGDAMTFAELESLLSGINSSAIPGNKILWKDFFNGVFGDDNANLTYDFDHDLISVQTVESFKNLSTFLSAQKTENILRFVWWNVVFEYAEFTTEEMSSLYEKLSESAVGKKGGTEKFCVSYVEENFILSLANEIKTVYGLANRTEKVEEMLHTLKSEFENMVLTADWLDDNTKSIIIEKTKSISEHVGFDKQILDPHILDSYYKNLKINTSEFLLNMVRAEEWQGLLSFKILRQSNFSKLGPLFEISKTFEVSAGYLATGNAIYVSAAILQRPFYYRGLEALNYGAIGSVLGHELTHGFDSEGRFFNKNGEYQENLWPYEISRKYEDRSNCFVNQYSKFDLTNEKKLDGSLTLRENIADNGGLRESYYAYQTYKKKYGPELKLPGFEEFSHEQLLFLSYGTLWCETRTSRYESLILDDAHSPNRVRVIATLQNMKEFANAFQCPSGSFMNPSNKCMIW